MSETPTTTTDHKVCFHTNGIIDPLSWQVMGLNAKLNDNTFGVFGTGLKYAIAVLLRNGHTIEIHTPTEDVKLYTFKLKATKFRGKDFNLLECNGEQLPYTTEYGKKWVLWQAYRELVSNTEDEGGLYYPGEAQPEGTSIVVTGEEFAACHTNHNDYFLGDREPLYTDENLQVIAGSGKVYSQGIVIGAFEKAQYSYAFTSHVDLTEDRTMKYQFLLQGEIANSIVNSKDSTHIRKMLLTPEDSFENLLNYDRPWGPIFQEVVSDLHQKNPSSIPKSAFKAISERGLKRDPVVIENEEYSRMVIDSKAFLKKAGYEVTAQIQIVENQDDNLIGFYIQGRIYLTERAFEQGMFLLTTTLLEEHMHSQGHNDYSRSFQDHLLNQVVNHAKARLKVSL